MASPEEMAAQIAQLQHENEQLRAGAKKGISLKVSEKGGLSVYGMGRFPVTLYPEQWESLLDMSEQIRAFIAENRGRLKWKES